MGSPRYSRDLAVQLIPLKQSRVRLIAQLEKKNDETSLDSVQIAVSCGDPDVFLLADHFGRETGDSVWDQDDGGCDRKRRRGFGTHVGGLFGLMDDATNCAKAGRAGVDVFYTLRPSPFRGLAFGILSAHGPHRLRILTPGLLFRHKPPSHSRPSTRILAASKSYIVLSTERTVQVLVDCFPGTFPAKQGRKKEKRILFVRGRVFRAID